MPGTFLGMVLTLHCTGVALDSASKLATIRQSLSEPVCGLGLAFSTSVASVASSVALGLLTVLTRRERAQAGRWLNERIVNQSRPYALLQLDSLLIYPIGVPQPSVRRVKRKNKR